MSERNKALGPQHRESSRWLRADGRLILDESVTLRVSILTALLVPLLAFAQHAPPAQPFQRLNGCAYKPPTDRDFRDMLFRTLPKPTP
jgi:hypothetical protein